MISIEANRQTGNPETKQELILAAGTAATLIKARIDAALAEVTQAEGQKGDDTEGKVGVWKIIAFGKRLITRMNETMSAGDDIFTMLHTDILRMGAILEQLRPHFEAELALKTKLEALSAAIENAETDELRASALAELMQIIEKQANIELGENPFAMAPESITPADVERRWGQIKQILPVIFTGITAELTIAQAFNRIYQDARMFYPVIIEARRSALAAAQLSRLSTETATLQVASYNVTVGYIDSAVALTEQAMKVYGQLDQLLGSVNPIKGVTNQEVLNDVTRRTNELQLLLTDGESERNASE